MSDAWGRGRGGAMSNKNTYTYTHTPTCEIVVIVTSPFHSHWTAVDSWNESTSDQLEIATVT